MIEERMKNKMIYIDFHEAKILNPSFLFLVHNDIEFDIMCSQLEPLIEYNGILKAVLEDQPYYIGQFGSQTIVLAKTSDMGSTKPFASLNTTTMAISYWQPTYVIMVGVMAGFDEKINIGDVVIARESIDYQNYKMKDLEYISRAHYYDSGTIYKLFDNISEKEFNEMFIAEDYIYNDEKGQPISYKIKKGKVLSGDVLVDSTLFKHALLYHYPEALGLEMEFRGVASACMSAGIANILMVKGVCDAGEKKESKNKNRDQKRAMINAVKLCRMVFAERRNFDKRKLKYSYSEIVNRSILISGSHDFGINEKIVLNSSITKKFIDCKLAKIFTMELVKTLQEKGFRIITGYGNEIGAATVAGVLSNINIQDSSYTLLSENLLMMPFPRINDIKYSGFNSEQFKMKYREIICKESKYAISLFGIKKTENMEFVKADGVNEELMIAYNLGRTIIPVGATEFMSREIWNVVKQNLDKFYPIDCEHNDKKQKEKIRKECFEKLGQNINFENQNERQTLINNILEFIKKPWESSTHNEKYKG